VSGLGQPRRSPTLLWLDLSSGALPLASGMRHPRLDMARVGQHPRQQRQPLLFSYMNICVNSYNRISLLLESLVIAGHAEIVTTVDQSAMRGLVPHEMIRQGLPHSTYERTLGSRRRAQGWVEDSPYRTLRMTSYLQALAVVIPPGSSAFSSPRLILMLDTSVCQQRLLSSNRPVKNRRACTPCDPLIPRPRYPAPSRLFCFSSPRLIRP
jgi:hypothetical protein